MRAIKIPPDLLELATTQLNLVVAQAHGAAVQAAPETLYRYRWRSNESAALGVQDRASHLGRATTCRPHRLHKLSPPHPLTR